MRSFFIALLLAALASAEPPRRFGVVISCEGRPYPEVVADLEAAAELGLGSVRLRPGWPSLQSEKPDAFDWTYTDRLLAAAANRNLEVLLTLGPTPRWASRYPEENEPAVWSGNPPRTLETWSAYVGRLAARERTVDDWQVWERSSIHFFRGSDKDLTDLSRATIRAVRQVDADALILMPEPGGLDLGAINTLYAWGAERFFNALALSPTFARPEQILRPLEVLQRDIVLKKGPRVRLWVTGFGWGVEPIPGPLARPIASQDEQARYLVRLAALALAEGVERVYWEALRDRSTGSYQLQSRAGLLAEDGTRRPAFHAYRTLIERLGNRPFRARADWGPHAHGLLFDGVLLAWSAGPAVRLEAPTEGIEAVDLFGHPVTDPTLLGESPIYLSGPGMAAWMRARQLSPAVPDPDYSQAGEIALGQGLRVLEGAVRREDGYTTDLAHNRSAIKFAVDDSFAYFVDGRYGLEIEVEVRANEDAARPMGFNLGYDSMKGYAFTRWQTVDPGTGWKTYTFRVSDADFSDLASDFRVNALGSKSDVWVRSVRVRKYVEVAPKKAYDKATK